MQKDDPKVIRAWTFYDWANSVYPLVITSAIFPSYYDAVTSTKDGNVHAFGANFPNEDIYSYVYAFALFLVVLSAPILSGMADYMGNKKRFLQFFCWLGASSCMCLYFFSYDANHPSYLELSFIPFITATIGFWGSLVFYNSYLPEIATAENQDKVSAQGFARGYFGSSLLLIICLVCIIVLKMPAKYSFLMVGIWWIGFAQYTFSVLPNISHVARGENKGLLTKGFKELFLVFKDVLTRKTLRRFLASYFFYNMGVQTIMVMAVLFARKEIEWGKGIFGSNSNVLPVAEVEAIKTNSLIISILLIQFLGIAGAYIFSWLSRKIGNIKALGTSIFIWIFVCVFTYAIAHYPIHFYIVAASVGLVMGGVQSLSRSTYSKYLPETEDNASYFSFYDVMEKLGMIIGTVSFAFIGQVKGGMRTSVLALIVFFVIGFLLLLRVPKSDKVQ
jgi:UMF1 family MFS transporter